MRRQRLVNVVTLQTPAEQEAFGVRVGGENDRENRRRMRVSTAKSMVEVGCRYAAPACKGRLKGAEDGVRSIKSP